LDYPILSDPGKDVAKGYGVVTPERPLPHRWTFYIDPEGKILHVDKEVKTQTAGADIAARLEELGVAKK
jgi:peroxiredoxin Q/BCP